METDTFKDCGPEETGSTYLDIPEFVTDIKQEIYAEESEDTCSKQESFSIDEELLYANQFFPIKIESVEKEKHVTEWNNTVELLAAREDDASVPSENHDEDKVNNLPGSLTFKCEKCTYETTNKNNFDKHILLAKHISHHCSVCGYKTSKIGNFKRHVLSHKSKEGYVHKCLECQFQITNEFAIYKHMAEHPSPSNAEPTTCQQCDTGTFDNIFGSQVLQVNLTPGLCEVKECYYQKCKKDDKVHVFSNDSIKEVSIFKCSECPYQTKRKGNLTHHMLRHKDRAELEMFACTECPYQSFNKSHLQTHLLTHKSGSEVTLYGCMECEYHSKYKADLRVHVLRHKSRSEVTMFQCNECPYQALRKCDLNRHLLRHKSMQEVKMHRCPLCTYQTFDKGNLNKHIYRHQLAEKDSVKVIDTSGLNIPLKRE